MKTGGWEEIGGKPGRGGLREEKEGKGTEDTEKLLTNYNLKSKHLCG